MTSTPHVRAAVAIAAIACSVVLSSGLGHAAWFALLAAWSLAETRGRVPSRGALAGVCAIGALTLVLNAVCTPGPRAFPHAAWAPVSVPGVHGGVLAAARIAEIAMISASLVRHMHADDVLDVATSVLAPLRYVPALRGADMMLGVAAASVPSVREEIDHAMLAVRLRDGREPRTLAGKARFARAVAIPSFLGVLHRAETMSRALAARGYDPARRRTSYVEHRITRGDAVLAFAAACIIAALVVVDRRFA